MIQRSTRNYRFDGTGPGLRSGQVGALLLAAMAALSVLNCAGLDDAPSSSAPFAITSAGDSSVARMNLADDLFTASGESSVARMNLTDDLFTARERGCRDELLVIPVGGGARASLEEGPCTGEQGVTEWRFGLVIETPRGIRVESTSADFNPEVSLHRADGSEVAAVVGDAGVAEIRARLVPGVYTIAVTSSPALEARGVFQLDVWNACLERQALSVGESVRERLEREDCMVDDQVVDTYTLTSDTPVQATIILESRHRAVALRVVDEAGQAVLTAEPPTTESVTEVSFVAPAGTYDIEVRGMETQTGSYRLSIAPEPCVEMRSARDRMVDDTCWPEDAVRESRNALSTGAIDRSGVSPVDASALAR